VKVIENQSYKNGQNLTGYKTDFVWPGSYSMWYFAAAIIIIIMNHTSGS